LDVQSSYFLRQGIARSLLVANAYRPVRNPLLLVPSFLGSWVTSEAAPAMLAAWGLRTTRQVALGRRAGQRLTRADALGLTLSAAAAVGAVGLIREALRAQEQFESALSPLMSAEELADRPSAVRLGALLPLLNGNRRRRRTRDIVFSEPLDGQRGPRLKLDVYMPLHDAEPGEKRPAVLQIHGGAWVLGSKNEQGIPLLNHLASCGWVGFNVDYRLSPRVKAPEHLVDCKRALAWVREHADEYGLDPDFIVVTGGSAGGHLCALMALTQNDPAFQPGFEGADTTVQAAVPFYGVYDLTDRDQHYGDSSSFTDLLTRAVMEVGLAEDPDHWAAYSPLDRITEDAPPMFVIHGDRDVLVPVAGARRFVADLRRTSKRIVAYAELRGAQHAFEVFPSFRTVETVEFVERFLHNVHSRYLDRTDTPEAVEPVPDDSDEEPRHAGEPHPDGADGADRAPDGDPPEDDGARGRSGAGPNVADPFADMSDRS
jgi:acetyl esterase/lipase